LAQAQILKKSNTRKRNQKGDLIISKLPRESLRRMLGKKNQNSTKLKMKADIIMPEKMEREEAEKCFPSKKKIFQT